MSNNSRLPSLVAAWLSARSVCRGLPLPVADRGGLRVDTALPAEARRWVFTSPGDGLREIGREVTLPRHPIKLSGPADELMAALPAGWQLQPQGHFMIWRNEVQPRRALPIGYHLETERDGAIIAVRVLAPDGSPAANGHGAEAAGVFIYDRIETAPEHQRKGLGNVVMNALKARRTDTALPQLLVATEEGRALYETLGWKVLSPFSTAAIPG
ncbi:GNAT family N-acetyltransferase [Novosphingobium sp. BL-8H]|uniref:GNAT family N-acetyltransferase n=1 Tax=Novosphingobium sp. BL-8H TaxID=3127640 RepID=UPI0037569B42